MALTSFATKLFRTLARVIPQCGMVSQAVAFNMFLAFFALLVTALSLAKHSLEGEGGQQVAKRIATILPPGSWQLLSGYVLFQPVNAWYLALIGWIGTLLVGTQVMKLIIKGVQGIYHDHDTHSFLGRQIRSLLLFCVVSVTWFVAVALNVFGQPLEQWIGSEVGNLSLVRNFLIITLWILAIIFATFVLALIYRAALPGAKWRSVLPGAVVAALLWWVVDWLFGIYVRKTQYGPIYGGLAAAIGLMAWMEISAMLIFVGAAWNSESAARGA